MGGSAKSGQSKCLVFAWLAMVGGPVWAREHREEAESADPEPVLNARPGEQDLRDWFRATPKAERCSYAAVCGFFVGESRRLSQ
jgi:hypothetical protein